MTALDSSRPQLIYQHEIKPQMILETSEMKPELVSVKKDEAQGLTNISNVRTLTSTESNQAHDAIKKHFEFDANRSLYDICRRNHDDLIQYWESQVNQFASTQKFDPSIGLEITLEMNRKLLSYLSSLRTFIDHTETRLKRAKEPDQLKVFKDRSAQHYDNRFAYRFLWKLRNYVQHCGLPPSGVNFSASDEGEQKVFTGHYHFNTIALRNGYDWGAKLTQDLQSQPSKLDVLSLVSEMDESLEDLNRLLASQEASQLRQEFNILIKLHEEVQQASPGAYPAIAEFKSTDDEEGLSVHLTWLPLHIMKKLEAVIQNT